MDIQTYQDARDIAAIIMKPLTINSPYGEEHKAALRVSATRLLSLAISIAAFENDGVTTLENLQRLWEERVRLSGNVAHLWEHFLEQGSTETEMERSIDEAVLRERCEPNMSMEMLVPIVTQALRSRK